MREPYVRLIAKYIKLNPKSRSPEDLKESLIRFGATEEEFDQALRQTTRNRSFQQPPISRIRLPKPTPDIIKKTATAVVTFIALVSFIYTTFIYQTQAPPTKTPLAITDLAQDKATVEKNTKNPIPQVYANLQPIDAQRVFSFPKSTVPLAVTSRPKKEVLGFFPYWMLPFANEINIDILTSISLFGLEVDGKGEILTSHADSKLDGGWLMWKDPSLDSFIKRVKTKGLKIFLTLKSFNNTNIEELVASDDSQKTFISNALYLINSKSLDGINLDFEYIGTPSDNVREGFTRLVTNLNTELKRQLPDAMLTIDTYIVSGSVLDLFDLPLLSDDVDAFVIMGYDMHYALGNPGPIAPMGGTINIIGLVQGYLEKVPAEKLILAVPYYGYDWPINLDSSAASPSAAILSYAELAEASREHKLIWDETSQTPSYRYTDSGIEREVHFENVRSLGIKYDFVTAKNLKGVGIWALGYDGLNSDLQRLIVDKFSN